MATFLTLAVSRLIAFSLPFHIRPMYNPTLVHHPFSVRFVPNLENWSAFPSDTAAYFFALAFGVAYLARRLAIPIMLYTVLWICLPRMYIGLHYASDIIAGAAVGLAVVWAVFRTEWFRSSLCTVGTRRY